MEQKISQMFSMTPDEVKTIIIKHLMKLEYIKGDVDMDKIKMSDITKTSIEQGGDPHDAYRIECFDGLKFTIYQ